MSRGQKAAFSLAVLFGIVICVALFLGKFSPPPEHISTPQLAVATFSTNSPATPVAIDFTSTEPVVMRIRMEASPFELTEYLPLNYTLELLDTTSPIPQLDLK